MGEKEYHHQIFLFLPVKLAKVQNLLESGQRVHEITVSNVAGE